MRATASFTDGLCDWTANNPCSKLLGKSNWRHSQQQQKDNNETGTSSNFYHVRSAGGEGWGDVRDSSRTRRGRGEQCAECPHESTGDALRCEPAQPPTLTRATCAEPERAYEAKLRARGSRN